MIPIWAFLKKLGFALKKLTVGSISVAIGVILYGTFSEYFLERNIPQSGIHSLFSGLWWTMQTLTTVGYGDTPIYGYLGKINAIFVMVVGIGSLGVFLASMSASITNFGHRRRIGLTGVRMKKHVIVCNYDHHARGIVKEITESGNSVVVISDKDTVSEEPEFRFVKGSCLDEAVLIRAGIKSCQSVVILAGRSTGGVEDSATDAMTILISMKIKSLSPQTSVTAEILSPESVIHAENAGVDESIVRGSLATHLISKSISFPGLSRAMVNVLSQSKDVVLGEEDGKLFSDVSFGDLNRDFLSKGRFVLGLRKGRMILKDLHDDSAVDCDGIIYMERKL